MFRAVRIVVQFIENLSCDFISAMSVKRLQELGFKESDCIKALQATSGRLEASATWLLENATPVHQARSPQQQGGNQGWQFAGFEVRRTLCFILTQVRERKIMGTTLRRDL